MSFNMAQTGVDDQVIISSIRNSGTVFHLPANEIVSLHQQGVSNKVIQAMLYTARKPARVVRTAPVVMRRRHRPFTSSSRDRRFQSDMSLEYAAPTATAIGTESAKARLNPTGRAGHLIDASSEPRFVTRGGVRSGCNRGPALSSFL